MPEKSTTTVWTIGHSTRSAEEFLSLLQENGIERLVDVRRFPGSRKYPHFNEPLLAATLPKAGIDYVHRPDLGGRRPTADSKNTAWRNESFRAYADYMETPEFQQAAAWLIEQANEQRTAIMCSEAVWWRCHRSLIADYLKVRGVEVLHILGPGKTEPHPYTSAAAIVDGRLSYAAEATANARQGAKARKKKGTGDAGPGTGPTLFPM
jgi:uncharacterized protein (DUF488 family)